jgi:hypothetical protein
MTIFYRPKYESEATQFLAELKAKKPEIEVGQRLGRSLLWDKQVDREAWRGFRAAQVAQKPYVYQTSGK